MASGQQKAQQNLEAFEVWKATQTDDDFKQIVFRGQLNRIEVAKGIGCGKSALNQNPALKKALKALEDELRGKGVLPPLTDVAKKNADKPKLYDNTANRKLLDSKRVSSLEAENTELKAKVKELEKQLERFGELSETLSEMGLMPR
ncbi:VPA1267 family protein [Vibrio sp.]|uniref:VPA1267 family protein n=1 Tax=Vibrio sp. TaxID=678 RepID=UPI00311E28E2